MAVWLNTPPDHIDRHGDMNGYVAAKKRIFRNQGAGRWAVIGVDDLYCQKVCTELMASWRAPRCAGSHRVKRSGAAFVRWGRNCSTRSMVAPSRWLISPKPRRCKASTTRRTPAPLTPPRAPSALSRA